jgi:hypothetical protein
MINEFEYIELVFENCNFVKIFPEDILYLSIDNIYEDIFINASHQFIRTKRCKNFVICLKSSAINIKTHFQEEYSDDDTSSFERHINIFKDISNILIKIDNNNEEYIAVPYDVINVNSDINILQKVIYDDNKLTIIISEENRDSK